MPVKEEELRQFFSTMSIEESFLHFASWAKARSYPVYILSDGYENYIKLLLERSHLDIPYYANRLYYDQGWKISCPYPGADCSRCGVCKRDLIQKLALPQYVLIYVGDGYSDVCPAEHCDLVFAKSNLAAYRRKNQLPYCPFVSFDDILKTLDRMLEKEAPNGL
jgi:2,3-diketo-5-methylthio-1-phosphopentane phosphatase